MNFQPLPTVNDTNATVEDPAQCDLPNDLHILPDNLEKNCNTTNSENEDILQHIELFWDLKPIFSRIESINMR